LEHIAPHLKEIAQPPGLCAFVHVRGAVHHSRIEGTVTSAALVSAVGSKFAHHG
jgi:hypothetical protein